MVQLIGRAVLSLLSPGYEVWDANRPPPRADAREKGGEEKEA